MSVVFNIAKGRGAELADRVIDSDPTNAAIVVVLLKVAEADATLIDYDTLAALLAGSNTEADFTNYARKVLTNPTVTVDDANDRVDVDLADQTWSSAGGASDNTLVKALICYDDDSTGGTDANIVPLVALDVSGTTNGNDLLLSFSTAYFYRAS